MIPKLSLDEWKRRAKFINPYMEILNMELDQKANKQYFTCHCNKCGGIFETYIYNLNSAYLVRLKGRRTDIDWCPVCSGRLCVPGINDIATLRPDLIKYFVDANDAITNTIWSHNIVKVKCPNCGKIKNQKIKDLCRQGFSCDICSDSISFPNKICRNLVLQLPVKKFEFEYSDKWTKQKKYDAYFEYNSDKYLLEFDGEQHYKGNAWSSAEEQQRNDKLKTKLALENGYILIRIDCKHNDFEYIKQNIFNSDLSNIFDLDSLDWDQIYQNSLKNMDIEIANYYMDNKNKTHREIAAHFYINENTLTKILKRLASIGLCDYNQSETKKNSMQYSNRRKKEGHIYFNVYDEANNNIGRFKSSNDCAKYLNSIFDDLNISPNMIRGSMFTGDIYKGFRFEYEIGLYEYHKNNKLLFDICDLYKNKNMKPMELSTRYNISPSMVYRYLRAGNNIGLCDYEKKKKNKVSRNK